MDPEKLISRISHVLQDDSRVLAAWLSGSRGRGAADQYSDVDVWLVVLPENVAGFIKEWPELSGRVTPTVLQQQVRGGPVFNAVTLEWLRFDVSIGTPEDVPRRSRSTLKPLFDRAGLTEQLKAIGETQQPDLGPIPFS